MSEKPNLRLPKAAKPSSETPNPLFLTQTDDFFANPLAKTPSKSMKSAKARTSKAAAKAKSTPKTKKRSARNSSFDSSSENDFDSESSDSEDTSLFALRACTACRAAHTACDRSGPPCLRCRQNNSGKECIYPYDSLQALRQRQKLSKSVSQESSQRIPLPPKAVLVHPTPRFYAPPQPASQEDLSPPPSQTRKNGSVTPLYTAANGLPVRGRPPLRGNASAGGHRAGLLRVTNTRPANGSGARALPPAHYDVKRPRGRPPIFGETGVGLRGRPPYPVAAPLKKLPQQQQQVQKHKQGIKPPVPRRMPVNPLGPGGSPRRGRPPLAGWGDLPPAPPQPPKSRAQRAAQASTSTKDSTKRSSSSGVKSKTGTSAAARNRAASASPPKKKVNNTTASKSKVGSATNATRSKATPKSPVSKTLLKTPVKNKPVTPKSAIKSKQATPKSATNKQVSSMKKSSPGLSPKKRPPKSYDDLDFVSTKEAKVERRGRPKKYAE